MKLPYSSVHQDTVAVHGGTKPDPITGALMVPISLSSTYSQEEPGIYKIHDYSRAGNPTRDALEEGLAALELGANFALSFASGLAAEQAVVQACLNPGDRVIVCDDVYGGTGRLFRRLFAKYGINFEFVDMTRDDEFEQIFSKPVQMVWLETPTNPTMKIIDISRWVDRAKKSKAIVVVDNTFASPVFQSPLQFGADIALHSSTKYLGGHSDMIGGALMIKDRELFEKIKFVQFAAGAVPSPFDAYLMLRSLKTLSIRMERHQANGLKVAEFLASHAKVEKIFHPGLSSHPQHSLAAKQMKGFSGMLSFRMKGDYEGVTKFLKKLQIFTLAESLGGVESLINHPEKMTHASVPEDLRRVLGIDSQLLRLSVGIEHAEDLIADLKNALA